MSRLPTLLMFATTSGHYGCRTIYRATLDHLDRLLPLVQWGARLFSVKAKPGEEWIAEIMKGELERRGFIVEVAVAPWQRGLSHYAEYLKDMIRMSQHPAVYDNPLVYWSDDDYLSIVHRDPFPRVLHRMCQLVESSPDILTARFLREQDEDALAPDRTVAIETERDIAWSRHWNLQPLIMRSRDMHRACKVIEDNWAQATQMHGEALWREVLAPLSRSERKHAVWLPSYAQVVNLGVPDYAAVAARLGLTIHPNP
jgi:hypothetical protein